LKQQQLQIIDPITVGLIYIERGTFLLTLKQKFKRNSDEFRTVIMHQGDYLDYEKIEKDYEMVLDSFRCESGTGQTLSLDHEYYMYLKQNSNVLSKARLHPLILQLNPPMNTVTEKRATKFLYMFKIETPTKGKVLQLESKVV